MSISNINDEIILSSSPFVGGKFSDQDGVGLIEMDCKIPSHFFNSQIYSIHLWFLKDLTKSFNNSNLPILSEQLFIKNSTEVVFTMKDAIKFKPTYKRNEIEFDLSNLNIKGALLPQFEWNQNLVTLEK
jgi:hypothetical protein